MNRQAHGFMVEYKNAPSNEKGSLGLLIGTIEALHGCKSEVELLELTSAAARKLSGHDRDVLAIHAREMHRRLAIR